MKTKTYTITMDFNEDGTTHMRRENCGFTPYELLGLCNFISMEVVQQMRGKIEPTTIERVVAVDKKIK